jgi:hypothetical protein
MGPFSKVVSFGCFLNLSMIFLQRWIVQAAANELHQALSASLDRRALLFHDRNGKNALVEGSEDRPKTPMK